MKKTIAKMMAAAMVLSTIVAPNAQAAGVVTVADQATANKLVQYGDATLYFGTASLASFLDYNSDNAEDDSVILELSSSEMDTLESKSDGTYLVDAGTEAVSAEIQTLPVVAGTKVGLNSVTNTSAASDTSTVTDDDSIYYLANAFKSTDTSKVVVNGEYDEVTIVRKVPAGSWVSEFWTAAGNTTVINTGYANHAELIRQLRNGASLIVRSRVFVNGVAVGWRWRQVTAPTSVLDNSDAYWNGIIKLKSSNNQYVPIRVHFDLEDGSLADGGLYVVMNNGTITSVNGIATTTQVSANNWASRRVEIQAVQANDLALLKSDVAKGKNLMLDEVYAFSVNGIVNNNGINSAGAGYYDFGVLGEDTTIATTPIGKITTIHSQLFKGTKEKLIHAENVKFINNGAFRKNKQLKKAIIGTEKNIKKINSKAFYDCKKLATVKLSGRTLKNVGSSAFKNCKSNMIFKIKGNSTQVKKAWAKIKKQAPAKAKYAKI